MPQRDPGTEAERTRPAGAIVGGIVLGLAASVIVIVGLNGSSDDGSADAQQASVESGSVASGASAQEVDGDGGEPGSLDPVRVGPAKIKDPVNLYQKAGFGTGVTARITEVEKVQGEGRGPGEISGPALRITVQLSNASARGINVPLAALAVTYGKQQTPAISLSKPGVDPLPAELAAKSTAIGKYVFAVPPGKRGVIRVSVAYSAKVPTLVFKGAAE